MSFSELNLNKNFIAAIKVAGYQKPTELQSRLIPIILDKKSVTVWTQSASGKTGSFLIPAINYILNNPLEKYSGARILILTSRKDRVNQINYTVRRLTVDQPVRLGFVVSGRPYQPQMRLLRRPLDLMVATPGRLKDLIENKKTRFSQLEMLIIDDLTTIYHKNLHSLINIILLDKNEKCPVISFARRDKKIEDYIQKALPPAIEIKIDENRNPLATIPQIVHLADDYTHKIALMDHLLDEFNHESTIIYTATTKSAKVLVENLNNHGHSSNLAHVGSNLQQFNSKNGITLVVSDQNLVSFPVLTKAHVVNFDLPKKIEHYVTRINHKNNMTREDAIIMLVNGKERDSLKKLEKKRGKAIDKQNIPGLEPINVFPNYTLSVQRKSDKQTKNINQYDRNGSSPQVNKPKIYIKQRKNRFGRLNGNGNIHRKIESSNGNVLQQNTNTPLRYKKSRLQYSATTTTSETKQQELTQEIPPKKRRKIIIRYKERRRSFFK